MSGWQNMQVHEFAKRFAYAHKPAWHAYVPDVREALIDSFVLIVVLGQDATGVQVDEIRSMRNRLGMRLATFHNMQNPVADLQTPKKTP